MKKIFLLVSFILIYHVTTIAQKPSIVLKESGVEAAGFSAKQLAYIDSVLQEYIDKKWIGGATAFVAKDGLVAYYKGIGYHDAYKKTPIKKDEIFRIASQTKAITSTAVMMLFEQGKFLLDDPLSKYIPEFSNPVVLETFHEKDSTYTTVPAKREITIRDLLTHTSGIAYAQIGSKEFTAIYSKNGITAGIGAGRDILKNEILRLAKMPLAHQSGERFTYGLNMDVLGYLVEVISGMNLNDFFYRKIFEPLGMKDTYFFIPGKKQSRLTVLNAENKDGTIRKSPDTIFINGHWNVNYPCFDGTYYSGGGGLSSTAYDYCIFLQMLLNGGSYNGHRILSPSTVHLMTMNQVGDLKRSIDKIGLGFRIIQPEDEAKLGESEGSFEWGGMWSSSYWVDPKKNIVAQLFINQYPMTHSEIHDKFKAIVYAALKE